MNRSEHGAVEDRGSAVCIIGAGPGGLSMARALRALGVPYEQFERHDDVGGLWDMRNPGSPVYESAHFISSRQLSGFIGYPMPVSWPDYPSHRHILSYVHGFADAYGLRSHIRFGLGVKRVRKESSGRWLVELAIGEQRRYAAVVCATGVNWNPALPALRGELHGEVRHANTYKSAAELRGKRVLVIGAGNSGVDIACDAAAHAARAFISMRRGYHIIPKHVLGEPADVFGEKAPWAPLWLKRLSMNTILGAVRGDVTRWGFPAPSHRLFESHPLLNDQILHHAQHGDLVVKPDVERLDGRQVVFSDGSREDVDLVLCATGYNWSIPYASDHFSWKSGRPELYLAMFNREHRNLFCIGYLETNSSAYKLFDTQAWMIASYLGAQRSAPGIASQFDALIASDAPDMSGGIRFVHSARHAVYLDAYTYKRYLKGLRQRFGWGEPDAAVYARLAVQPLPQPTLRERVRPEELRAHQELAHDA